MQLTYPIDIENALRIDVGELTDLVCFAPPAPDDLQPGSVCFTSVGGQTQTEVSNEYSVSVDCWGEDYAQAVENANRMAGLVASLPFRSPSSGRHYVTADINATPYINPDPLRPTLPRASFRAEVGIRGESIF